MTYHLSIYPPTDDDAQITALYGAADVTINGMEAESVALTPFSPLAIGGGVGDAHFHMCSSGRRLCFTC